jgi:hypothetical protein
MSTSSTSLIDIAFTIGTKICVDIVFTTVSSIIIAVCIVGLIITKTVTNHRGSISKHTIIFMKTCAFYTEISVDVDTAVSTIIITLHSVSLIIAKIVSNPMWMRAA